MSCDPMECSLPGSSVHEIFQASVLEWAAISFPRRSSQSRHQTRVSHIAGRRFTIWAAKEASPMISYCLSIYRISIIFALPKQNIFLLNLQIAVCLWWKLKICVPQNFSVKQNVSYICVCHRTVMISDMFLCIRVSLFAKWRWCRSLTIPLLLPLLLNHFSHVRLFVIPWIAAYQAPSMGFSRQEY